MDDWNLVRTQDGKVGWVLTRPLNMAIPDEVAQYAEGHRITSYFALGQVRDRRRGEKQWLWTTIAKGGEPYEFDSFRVFVWSLKHHRYETAYIERNIVGHYPVQVSTSRFVAELFCRAGRQRRATGTARRIRSRDFGFGWWPGSLTRRRRKRTRRSRWPMRQAARTVRGEALPGMRN